MIKIYPRLTCTMSEEVGFQSRDPAERKVVRPFVYALSGESEGNHKLTNPLGKAAADFRLLH